MRDTRRVKLFKAVKYEVAMYHFDHGMNLAQMWAAVNNPNRTWWLNICLEDYANRDIDVEAIKGGYPL